MSFNTTLVWVRQGFFWVMYQYKWVSIQRLFGFDIKVNSVKFINKKFQYNACLGSTLKGYFKKSVYKGFQYNACLGSTKIGKRIDNPKNSFNTTLVWVRRDATDRRQYKS